MRPPSPLTWDNRSSCAFLLHGWLSSGSTLLTIAPFVNRRCRNSEYSLNYSRQPRLTVRFLTRETEVNPASFLIINSQPAKRNCYGMSFTSKYRTWFLTNQHHQSPISLGPCWLEATQISRWSVPQMVLPAYASRVRKYTTTWRTFQGKWRRQALSDLQLAIAIKIEGRTFQDVGNWAARVPVVTTTCTELIKCRRHPRCQLIYFKSHTLSFSHQVVWFKQNKNTKLIMLHKPKGTA